MSVPDGDVRHYFPPGRNGMLVRVSPPLAPEVARLTVRPGATVAAVAWAVTGWRPMYAASG